MMEQTKKYAELDDFNAIACLLVVFVHVLSAAITALDPSSVQAAIVFLPWKLSLYVVRGFLFTGAVKMALGFARDDRPLTVRGYLRYMLRRVTKIWLPYAAWVGVYYIYFLRVGWVKGGMDVFWRYVFVGDLSAQFYYVVVVMQFYLLMPLWKRILDRVPFFSAALISAAISFLMLYSADFLPYVGLPAIGGRIFASYLLFWVLGLYVGRHYDTVRAALTSHVRAVMAMLIPILLYAVGALIEHAKGITLFDDSVMKMFTDTMSVCVVLTLCILFRDHAQAHPILRMLKRPLAFVYAASYTVYLSHCLFLQITASKLSACGITDIGVQLLWRALVCFTVPFLLWYLWQTVKKGAAVLIRNCMRKKA